MLGQLAPHDTGQLPAETVQAAPPLLQTPADALSVVEAVQPQVPHTGQLAGETVQVVVLPLQTPAEAESSVSGVHPQSQTVQPPPRTRQAVVPSLQTPADALSVMSSVHPQSQTGQPPLGTVQAVGRSLQMPSDAPSKSEVVQLQVPQGGTTSQLFAATMQDRDDKPVQGSPSHPADTATLLDCVPALDASAVDAVQTQAPQDPHWQSRSCVPSASLCRVSSQLPTLQPGLQVLVLVWSKVASQACVEAWGDHADHEAVPQGIRWSQYCVPVAPRLVEQSPVLQPALQVLVWVKGRPEQ